MTVIYRMRREWFRMQGQFPPEDVQAAQDLLHKFGQRAGESESEWRARLKRDNEAFMAEMDRLEAEEESGRE